MARFSPTAHHHMSGGLEQAAVEVIAENAGASPRTFFNYFPAKEDAVLGLRVPALEPAGRARPSFVWDFRET